MLSPFPGMDPWLEHPEVFPDLHDSFIAYSREALQHTLPSPYFAVIGRRNWIEVSRRYIEPDVKVLHRGSPARPKGSNGGVAVATPGRSVVVAVPHDTRHETFLDIYTRQGGDKRLVVTIEVLSWANKTPGEHGRDMYIRKQDEILQSNVHLVEIDLLRGGTHATAVPRELAVAAAGSFDYHVCLHRFDKLDEYVVYPIGLKESLPRVDIPLLPGDPVVAIDLQSIFNRSYESGPYRREVRYLQDEPVPPLTAEQLTWARERIQQTPLPETEGR
jgi:Protein of unknown function (DUF4058)